MSWASKLESKLSPLTEASSHESLATLAKWICFNRKHANDFCRVLQEKLSAGTKQRILIDLISCVLLNDHGSTAWDRGSDLRRRIAESVLLPSLPSLSPDSREHILTCTKLWDEANSFGGPTLILQIRKQLAALVKTEKNYVSADETGASRPHESTVAALHTQVPDQKLPTPSSDAVSSQEDEFDLSPVLKKPRTASSSNTAAASDAVTYDFEGTGIPFVKTEPSQLLESCGQVANLQIARDIRNDSAIQLNSLFTALPEDVRRSCAEAAEAEGDYSLPSDDMARDYSIRVNQRLIDMDMNEQMLNLFQLRKMIEQQREARQTALKLLIQSRCQFGSNEAAAAFYVADRGQAELSSRRQILLDAMELEGCGVEDDDEDELKKAGQDADFEPLTWYKPSSDEAHAETV